MTRPSVSGRRPRSHGRADVLLLSQRLDVHLLSHCRRRKRRARPRQKLAQWTGTKPLCRHRGSAVRIRWLSTLAFPPAARGGIPGALPTPQTAPRRVETSIAACTADPAMCAPMSCSSYLRLLPISPLAALQLFGSLISARTTTRTTHAQGMRSAQYPSKPWDAAAPTRCSSSAKPPALRFPSPDTRVPPASPMCAASSQ
jgi:hypothetical protein